MMMTNTTKMLKKKLLNLFKFWNKINVKLPLKFRHPKLLEI
jgi:hypothetical protein